MGELIVGGNRYACEAVTTSWYVTGLQAAGPMRDSADLVVLDWSDSDALAEEKFRKLQDRRDKRSGERLNMAANIFIDHHGLVTQWADALVRVNAGIHRHATRVGVSVLFSNRADANKAVRGVPREVVIETKNSETTAATTLTAAQMSAGRAVVATLCGALGIPMVVPMDGPRVASNVLAAARLSAFRGVVGAFHLRESKQGAGLAILRSIATNHNPVHRTGGAREE
jgi:hypothetical protein